jgi:hypothetical protein
MGLFAAKYRYANVDSVHSFIVPRIWARISNAKKFPGKKAEKYDYGKIIMLEKQDEYKQKLTEHVQELIVNSNDRRDSRWEKITCTVHKTAGEVFGKTNRKHSNIWFDKEAKRLQKRRIKHMLIWNSEAIQGL